MPAETKRVLIVDYAWPDVDVEREVLAPTGAEVVVAPTGEPEEVMGLVPEMDAIFVNWRPMTAEMIAAAGRCQVIARYGVGVDNIDVEAASRAGIAVVNVPDYCMDEVSSHAMALLLALSRRLFLYNPSVHAGVWDVKVGAPVWRMAGLTFGIVGFGRIGRAVAPKAQGFGLKVIACDPYIDPNEMIQRHVTPVDLDTLLRTSDFVTLHVPLTPQTRGMIGAEALAKMKPSAYLANTARGPVVDVAALAAALREGRLAGAGLDVLPHEPPDFNDPLFNLPNLIVSPHAAFYSEGSLAELQLKAAQRVAEALQGQIPSTVVNPAVLDQPNCRLAAVRR